MILLDTNALIWLDTGHKRVKPLLSRHHRLYISPASLLELQFLREAGRVQLADDRISALAEDDRWMLDDPPAAAWFETAAHLSPSIGSWPPTRSSAAGSWRPVTALCSHRSARATACNCSPIVAIPKPVP